MRTEQGKLYLFVGIDRTSKFTFVELHEKATRRIAGDFLRHLIAVVPYRARACAQADIDHRLAKPKHPWTNGQIERMNRTIKEATVKRFHYESHDKLRSHLSDFIDAYNSAGRLRTLNGLTPYEFICKVWTKDPAGFNVDPTYQSPGLNR